MPAPIFLGVNVDHVATLRQARGTRYPDPVHAALQAELAGADGITMHLREDRRHIQDHDVERFAQSLQTKLNFEMAATEEMQQIAIRLQPRDVCVVPEKREEVTTEGGLDVAGDEPRLKAYTQALMDHGIRVSMFIDPDEAQIEATLRTGAEVIELHTGTYADATSDAVRDEELVRITNASRYAHEAGLIVNAGHGLNTRNVAPIARIPEIHELNIGHSLITDAVFAGLPQAVRTMKQLMVEARLA